MHETHMRKEALESPQTLATVIHAIVREQYGEEAYTWDPLTVYLETTDDFRADMAAQAVDRWSAMQVIMLTDAFFKRLDAFLGICNTLAVGAPFFQFFDPVTTEEAAWAVTEVSLNRELLPFSYPIKRYLKIILKEDGYAEGDYPDVFEEVFRKAPSSEALRGTLRGLSNRDNTERFVDDQLRDLVVQFNRIPGLQEVDNIILQRSLDEYAGTVAEETS